MVLVMFLILDGSKRICTTMNFNPDQKAKEIVDRMNTMSSTGEIFNRHLAAMIACHLRDAHNEGVEKAAIIHDNCPAASGCCLKKIEALKMGDES